MNYTDEERKWHDAMRNISPTKFLNRVALVRLEMLDCIYEEMFGSC